MSDKNLNEGKLKTPLKFSIALGMLSSVAFFTMVILGQALWVGYNPISTVISELTADGSPNAILMRIISNISYISLILFAAGMCVISFMRYRFSLRFGYVSLLLMALISIVGFGVFPLTIERTFSVQNAIHIIITAGIICITIIAGFSISYGYLKYDRLRKLGRISLVLTILFTIFNIMLLFHMLQQSSFTGLVQRLGIFTFYIYIFILSCVYASHDSFLNGKLKA